MKNSRFTCCSLVIFFLSTLTGFCQYPVQVQVVTPQPAPSTLPELLGRTGEVVLILTNTDPSSPIDVMFGATITGDNGFRGIVDPVQKKPAYPLTLNPGEPVMLTGDEIIDIFGNYTIFDINYEGFELQELVVNPVFPEGIYTVCVEVYKFGDNVPISAPAPMNCSAPITLRTPDPPIITFPREKEDVPYGPFHPIPIRWTNVTHPGSFFLYNLRLAVCPNGINPYDAIESSNFLVYEEKDIPANLLLYDLTKPPLTDDSYVVRIQAYDPTGQVKVKNEGWSDVVPFQIKKEIPSPPRLREPDPMDEWEDKDSYRFWWTTITAGNAPINYRLQVAVFKPEVANSYEEAFNNPDLILLDETGLDGNSFQYNIPPQHDLDPYVTYLARVQAYDKTGTVTVQNDGWSEIHDFTILPSSGQEPNNFSCGEGCTTAQPTGLATGSFSNGQEVSMGNFTIKLTDVSVNGSTYNGAAEILPGNFFDSPVSIDLVNAKFNSNGKAIAGMARAAMPGNSAVPASWTTTNGSMSAPANAGTARNHLASNAYTLGSGSNSPQQLPLRFGNIYITALELTPTTAEATLASISELRYFSNIDGYLVFGKKGTCISPGGPAVGGSEAQLPLLQNATVGMNSKMNLYFQRNVTSAPNGGTVLPFDCNGALPIAAVGYVRFNDPALSIKVNANYLANRRVYGQFAAEIHTWHNWTADLNFSLSVPSSFGSGQAINFKLNDLKGFNFSVPTAVLDHSTSQNVPGFAVAASSGSGGSGGASLPFGNNLSQTGGSFGSQSVASVWQGVVFQDATVALPAYFEGDSGGTINSGFPNLYFDGTGLGGQLEKNFAPDPQGKVGLWGIDFGNLNIHISENILEAASFAGKLDIPFFQDRFSYEASYSAGYEVPSFEIDIENEHRIDIWNADVQLDQNAQLYVFPALVNDELHINTSFNGSLTFDNRIDDVKGLLLRDIGFHGMGIFNHPVNPFGGQADPIYIASFSIPYSSQKIAGYFSNINNIRLQKRWNNEMELKFHYDFKLDNLGVGLNTNTNFTIRAQKNGESWERTSSNISAIYFNEEIPGLDVKGYVHYQNNPGGYGFGGNLKADVFHDFVELDVEGAFGTSGSRKYWSLLASAQWGSPLPIFPGVNMKAFGGGAYYNMNKESSGNSGSFDDVSFRPRTSGSHTFGILANTLLQSIDPSEFNGRFLLEVDLQDWSLANIRLSGHAHFFDEIRRTNHWLSTPEPAGNAQIKLNGDVKLKWSGAKFLSANLGYDINLKPNGIITGSHSNALDLYFSASRWHVKLGEPTNPLPLNFHPNMRVNGRTYSLGSVNTRSYFMTGSFGNAQAGLEIDYSKTWTWNYELGFANLFRASIDFDFDMDGAVGYGLTNCSNHDPDDFFAMLSGAISLSGSVAYYDRCDGWNPADWFTSCNRWRGLGGSFGLSGSLYTPDPTGLTGTLEIGFSFGGDNYGIDLPFRLGSRCE
ncbi:MAG: hypothetical protein AAFZ15_18015 [Bacteroidota bacterium]